MRKKPHDLQWLEVVKQRSALNPPEIAAYQKAQQGFLGEVTFDQMVETFLNKEFEFLNDFIIDYQNNQTQIDKLLVVGKIAYLIDMKYYQGNYQFKNNNWYLGEKVLTHNNFEQLRRAVRILQDIFRIHKIDLEVHGVLAFMNPESNLKIIDKVNETVLNYADIPFWCAQLNQIQIKITNLNWQNVIEKYEIKPYKTTNTFPIENIHTLKKGICCSYCQQFHMKENRHMMHCACGYAEAKEKAFTRTICEYGVIFHDYSLKRPHLRIFFGNNLNKRYLEHILTKHFDHIQNQGRKAGYVNKGILFDYWFEEKMPYFQNLSIRKKWRNS